jgi:hypothetical protein
LAPASALPAAEYVVVNRRFVGGERLAGPEYMSFSVGLRLDVLALGSAVLHRTGLGLHAGTRVGLLLTTCSQAVPLR